MRNLIICSDVNINIDNFGWTTENRQTDVIFKLSKFQFFWWGGEVMSLFSINIEKQ